jgi:hypothetical protein
MMRKIVVLSLMMIAISAVADTKDAGTTTLKDVQAAGTTDKNHKHQQYDLSFTSVLGKQYTCRTKESTSVNATELEVGSSVSYEVKGSKGKVKNSAGKQFSCTIVRVAEGTGSTH